MQRISSGTTAVSKRVFPIFWFGFLAVFFLTALFVIPWSPENVIFLVMPVVMAAFGYFLMKALVFDLVDEVWDAGDHLVVRNKGEDSIIRLEDIVNLNYSTFSNPKRATLRLRSAGRLGREIAFIPVSKVWPPFARNEIIDGLVDRIDAARRKSGA